MGTANPKIQANSWGIEGVTPVPEMDYVPFQGGEDIVREIYQLKLGMFSKIVNFRPMRPGLQKRPGCTPLCTVKESYNAVSLYMFSKGRLTELHTYAQYTDGTVKEATAQAPTITTGNWGATVYTSPDPSNIYPASYAVVNDIMYFADGTSYPQVYAGILNPVENFIIYKGSGSIPTMPEQGFDYTLQVWDADDSTVAKLDGLQNIAAFETIFVCTPTPANSFKFTFKSGKVNTTAAVAQIHYWNGSWTGTSGFTDGTVSVAGKTMSGDGTMSFTMPTDCIPHYLFDASGFWYRISLASGGPLSADVKLNQFQYGATVWQSIQNVWDGIPDNAIEAYLYTSADASYDFYAGTAITISGMTSSDKVTFNSNRPIIAFYVNPRATPNLLTATMTVKYNNGTTFTAVSNLDDQTSVGGITLSQPGWVSFTHPSDEQPGTFRSSTLYSYWYEISFNATISADTVIGISTRPYLDLMDYGKCIALCAYKNRMAYSFEKIGGYIAMSGAGFPMGLNGVDFTLIDIGDGRVNKAVAIKRFYNELLVWQEEKGKDGGCLTLIEGYSVPTFGKRIISTLHGTFSNKSAVVVEDVPGSGSLTVSGGQLTSTKSKITAAYFICRDGIYVTDGKGLELISGHVQDYFDPRKSICIRRGYEKQHWIDYDSVYKVLRVGLVTGASATTPNVFLVYDIENAAWMEDDLAQPLLCHTEVEGGSGQFPLLQLGGGATDGFIYQLNLTYQDSGQTITAYVVQEFDGGGHDIHLNEIVLRASGTCTITPYADGVANPDIVVP